MNRILLALFFCLFFSIAAKAQKDSVPPERVWARVEVTPSYPGGIEAFYKFLNKNVAYPKTARINGTQGKVIVSFIVEADGNLTNVKVLRGIGDGCDEESIRVLKLSSPWKPGMQGGHAVRVAYSVPVSFTLSD